jgi:hypothetical protein
MVRFYAAFFGCSQENAYLYKLCVQLELKQYEVGNKVKEFLLTILGMGM